MTKKLKCLVTVLSVLLMAEVACGMTWKPKLEDSPTLHATAINIKVKLKSPVPAKIVISLLTMEYYNIYHKDTNDKGVFWQAEVMTNGNEIVETILNQQDFKYVYKDRTLISPCRIANTYQVDVTTDGVKDDGIAGVEVSWINDDKTVFPWETDPAPLTETGGVTWWPGVSTNNAGHFGYRYEPNGLLIDNVGFGCIETSWYYFKNAANEPFQFNFKIPESLEPNKQFIIKSDTDAKTGEVINRTGEGRQTEYKVDKGIYGKDMIDADWTSMRWKRNVRTKAGKEYWQELRYSILAPGIQVETNSPEFILSFQEGKGEKAPAAVVWMSNKGLVVTAGDQVNPALMRENWLVLLAEDGTPEIPVMVVFQHRPEHLKWRSDGMVVQRGKGVGTLAIGRPFGVKVQETNTRALWGKNPHLISGQSFKQFAELMEKNAKKN